MRLDHGAGHLAKEQILCSHVLRVCNMQEQLAVALLQIPNQHVPSQRQSLKQTSKAHTYRFTHTHSHISSYTFAAVWVHVMQLSCALCSACVWDPLQCSHPSHPNIIFASHLGFFLSLQVSTTNILCSPPLSLPLFLTPVSHLSESMILLGSIERAQLQSLLSQQLGRARRLEYIREQSAAEKKRLSEVSHTGSEEECQRVSQEVRFQVRALETP